MRDRRWAKVPGPKRARNAFVVPREEGLPFSLVFLERRQVAFLWQFWQRCFLDCCFLVFFYARANGERFSFPVVLWRLAFEYWVVLARAEVVLRVVFSCEGECYRDVRRFFCRFFARRWLRASVAVSFLHVLGFALPFPPVARQQIPLGSLVSERHVGGRFVVQQFVALVAVQPKTLAMVSPRGFGTGLE